MNNLPNTVFATRKIQLIADYHTKEEVDYAWTKLRDWRFICFKAANYILAHQYVQLQLQDFFYFVEDIRLKLKCRTKDSEGILETSRQNTTYRLLSSKFKGQIPTAILSSLNINLTRHFNNEWKAYQSGERTLRNYKRSIPIPIDPTYITHIEKSEDDHSYSFIVFGLKFRTYFGRDFTDKRRMWEDGISGNIKFCNSLLIMEGRKLFLLARYEIPRKPAMLDAEIIAEAELSIEVPVILRIGKYRFEIGNKEEFLFRRLAIQSTFQRLQRGMRYNRSANGLHRRKRKLDSFHDKEKAYVQRKLHLYSRILIDTCVKHGAATLLLLGQQEKAKVAQESHFLLRNWSYHNLISMLRYKAEKAGINLILE